MKAYTRQDGAQVIIPETAEDRIAIKKLVLPKHGSKYLPSKWGSPMTPRKEARQSLKLAYTGNNRKATPERSKLRQVIELMITKVLRIFPDKSKDLERSSYSPRRFKVIHHKF